MPFIKSLLNQRLRIKYKNFIDDKNHEYPCNRILNKLKLAPTRHVKTTLLEGMIHSCDDENDTSVKQLNRYLVKFINILPNKTEPIVVGTYPSKGLMVFLKELQKFGTLAYSFSNYVLESNPLQQDICISFIKDGKSMLAVATLGSLFKSSISLKNDSRCRRWSFYPDDASLQEKPYLQSKRDLILFIQTLQPLCEYSLQPPSDSPYWGWQEPEEDL